MVALLFVGVLPARAGQETGTTLKWQPRAASAAPETVRMVAHAEPARPAKPAAQRAVLQWTNSRNSYQPPGAKRTGAILELNYEEAAPSASDAPPTGDPNANKNPFDLASQPEKKDAAEPTGELPIPETTEPAPSPPAAELPIPDTSEPAPKPFDEPKTEPAPEAPAAEPAPPPADQLFKDEPIPKPRESELPLPPGDLSEGILTKPGEPGCKGYDKQCREALRKLQERDITTVVVGVVIEGTEGEDFPCDCKVGRDFEVPQFVARNFAPTIFTWKASGICHKPLYFEDVQLERYGHSWNPIVQPFVSGAHFFVSVPLLPYKMGLRPPHECVYTLGYYRPGSCAPYMFEPIPLSLRAAAFQAAGATAFAFWFWPPN